MKTCHWRASMVALLLGAGLLASTIEDVGKIGFPGFFSSAHAQPLRKLIARLRGETLPAGIAKAEGRIEAIQADVSSKYPGQLAEISVEEGTKVAIGQTIGRVSSPEFEPVCGERNQTCNPPQDGLAGAEAEIASRRSALIRQVRFRARTGAHEVRLHYQAGIRRTAAQLPVGGSSGPEHDRPEDQAQSAITAAKSQCPANRGDRSRISRSCLRGTDRFSISWPEQARLSRPANRS